MNNEFVRRWSKIIALASILYGIGNLYQPTVVVGNSMAPTLDSGKVIWVDRTFYKTHTPKRGEVIIFTHNGEALVKRVYRGPGETVHYITNGQEIVEPIRENRVAETRARFAQTNTRLKVETMKVPEDAVFVLGDNYPCSVDSRQLGPIPIASIVGRAHLETDPTVALPYEYVPRRVRPVQHVRHEAPAAVPGEDAGYTSRAPRAQGAEAKGA